MLAEAEIIVNDGETLVLGGMIEPDATRCPGADPGRYPMIGLLFRHKSHTKEKLICSLRDAADSPAGP